MAAMLRAAGSAAVLALVAITASDTCRAQEVIAYNEKRPDIDYDAFRAAIPQFKALGAEALEDAKLLLETMEKLAATEKDETAAKAARADARDLLVKYRDNKVKVARLADTVMMRKGTPEPDMDILNRLRQTELVGISWPHDTKYIDCLRDLAGALKVNFVMHPDVLKFNTVEAAFPRSSADAILRAITTGFDIDYFVYDGEIILIKTLKFNDRRMQAYLTKHPDWKFWRPKEIQQVEDDL
jgi:hypothetical protein